MFTGRYKVAIEDTVISVAEAGDTACSPLVLLHGGLQDRTSFGPLASALGDRFRVIVIETRGHGGSQRGQAPMSYGRLEDDVTAVLNSLDIPDAALVGHSDGGIVGLRLACSGGVRPRFLVTISAHAQLDATDPTRDIYQELSAGQWRDMFPADVERYERDNPAPDFDRLFTDVQAMWLGFGDRAYPGERVRQIQCPLLVVHGEDDVVVSRRHSFELAEMVAGARLLSLPYASHAAHEEQADDIAAAIVRLSASCHGSAFT